MHDPSIQKLSFGIGEKKSGETFVRNGRDLRIADDGLITVTINIREGTLGVMEFTTTSAVNDPDHDADELEVFARSRCCNGQGSTYTFTFQGQETDYSFQWQINDSCRIVMIVDSKAPPQRSGSEPSSATENDYTIDVKTIDSDKHFVVGASDGSTANCANRDRSIPLQATLAGDSVTLTFTTNEDLSFPPDGRELDSCAYSKGKYTLDFRAETREPYEWPLLPGKIVVPCAIKITINPDKIRPKPPSPPGPATALTSPRPAHSLVG